jgi:hypothetical protein
MNVSNKKKKKLQKTQTLETTASYDDISFYKSVYIIP